MQPLHALKKRPAPLGRRPDGTPGRPMAVAVAWYGGLREMIYIYIDYLSSLLYLQLVATKETPAGRRGWGLGKGEGDGNDTSFFCGVNCDGGRALLEDICRFSLHQFH